MGQFPLFCDSYFVSIITNHYDFSPDQYERLGSAEIRGNFRLHIWKIVRDFDVTDMKSNLIEFHPEQHQRCQSFKPLKRCKQNAESTIFQMLMHQFLIGYRIKNVFTEKMPEISEISHISLKKATVLFCIQTIIKKYPIFLLTVAIFDCSKPTMELLFSYCDALSHHHNVRTAWYIFNDLLKKMEWSTPTSDNVTVT